MQLLEIHCINSRPDFRRRVHRRWSDVRRLSQGRGEGHVERQRAGAAEGRAEEDPLLPRAAPHQVRGHEGVLRHPAQRRGPRLLLRFGVRGQGRTRISLSSLFCKKFPACPKSILPGHVSTYTTLSTTSNYIFWAVFFKVFLLLLQYR